MRRVFCSLSIATVLLLARLASAATPCDGIDRGLTEQRNAELAPPIAKQLHLPSVDVLEQFQSGQWSIVYVSAKKPDNVFLFYSHDPLTSKYRAMWSGAAAFFEEDSIRDWTLKNAHGIPKGLAACFAWHVTKDRDM